jgi:DNA-binding PadR family transcriptional regulator
MQAKGLLEWDSEDGPPERGGHPRRRFTVTGRGVAALRESREAFRRLLEGLDGVLGESGS